MEEKGLSLEPYTFDAFIRLVSDTRSTLHRTSASLLKRTNAVYFKDYLKKCKASIIVVEHQYVDRDYLHDYSAYYVQCFSSIPKQTKRIHLFREIKFTRGQFDDAVAGSNTELLEMLKKPEHYIGFIVVKPLPKTFIGRTCLSTYDKLVPAKKNHERHYTVQRTYHANLCGIPLTVRSLAFQEQDNEVAACATSALWSLFHGTAEEFGHAIPSPHAITHVASSTIADWSTGVTNTRRFPNPGLTLGQITLAIRHVGLEACLIGIQSPSRTGGRKVSGPLTREGFSPAAYAYLAGGIPLLLTGELLHLVPGKKRVPIEASKGHHAMTILGFGLDFSKDPKPLTTNLTRTFFRGMRIDRIYVHDDQIGPFARMEWMGDTRFETAWGELTREKIFAKADYLVAPLIDRIRIPYDTVEQSIVALNELVREWIAKAINLHVEWDIRLLNVNSVKTEIQQDTQLAANLKLDFLYSNLPKYIWFITGWLALPEGMTKGIQIFVDASALEQEGGLLGVIHRNDFVSEAFFGSVEAERLLPQQFETTLSRKLIEHFRGQKRQ